MNYLITLTKYKGVHWDTERNKWLATIVFNRDHTHLGSFDREIEAARAYDRAAEKYHGQFAALNFTP